MIATQRDIEVVHYVKAYVVYADAEFASLIVIKGLVVIAIRIVDFQGVENQIRTFRGNGLDVVLVTVIVLFGDAGSSARHGRC